MATIDEIKRANRIEEVISETVRLEKRGHEFQGREHDSLRVNPEDQLYTWFSHQGQPGWAGDVITWVQHHVLGGSSHSDAFRWLCQRAGLPFEVSQQDRADMARADAFEVAARIFQKRLQASQEALEYIASRGWTLETATAARLGFSGSKPVADKRELQQALQRAGVDLESPAAVALVGYKGDVAGWAKAHGLQPSDRWLEKGEIYGWPTGHLVYVHAVQGKAVYLASRSIGGEKRHHNPQQQLAPKRPMLNHLVGPRMQHVALVEGQADAVTLGQLNVPAIALAGLDGLGDEVLELVDNRKRRERGLPNVRLYLGLDADAAGLRRAHSMMVGQGALDPTVSFAVWPRKDANDWLREDAVTPEQAGDWLRERPTYVEYLAEVAGAAADGEERDSAILLAVHQIARLPQSTRMLNRTKLARKMRLKLGELDVLLKAKLADPEDKEGGSADDDFPTLFVSGGQMVHDHFMDLVWDDTFKRFRLAVRYPDASMGVVNDIVIRGFRYVPIEANDLMALENTIIFPSGINEAGQPLPLPELHRRVMKFANTYFDADPPFQAVAAYYVILTWVYDCFTEVPYLRMVGPYGTGKSRFVNTYGFVCYRAIRAAGSSSVSPIFRTLHLLRGTLVMDEINAPDKSTDPELEMVFKLGNQKLSPAILRTGGDGKTLFPEGFRVFGPKVFGAIKPFSDPATDSRCITYRASLATTRDDIPAALGEDFLGQARELRRELMTFRMARWQSEVAINPADVDKTLEKRSQQIASSLFALIDDVAVRESITAMLREQEGEMRGEREFSMEAKALRAVMETVAQPQTITGNQRTPYWDLRLTMLLKMVRKWIFDEEDSPDERRNDPKDWVNKYSAKKLASVFKGSLGLRVDRQTWDPAKAYGVILEARDLARLPALCRKYGVEFKPPADHAAGAPAQAQMAVSAGPEEPPVDDYLMPADD